MKTPLGAATLAIAVFLILDIQADWMDWSDKVRSRFIAVDSAIAVYFTLGSEAVWLHLAVMILLACYIAASCNVFRKARLCGRRLLVEETVEQLWVIIPSGIAFVILLIQALLLS